MSPRDWQTLVEQMPDVCRLVHLAMRKTPDDVEQLRAELLRRRRWFYEMELTEQARRVGCPGRTGRLSNGSILSELNEQSRADASSIVNTYNYDLAIAILHIRAEVPTANRHVYAKRLQEWEARRAEWKNDQIDQYTENSARARALQDFYQYNDTIGYAVLEPQAAVCPVCQGWIGRGETPLHVAMNNPPPYHVNCPHVWDTFPDKVPRSECPNLWMGR